MARGVSPSPRALRASVVVLLVLACAVLGTINARATPRGAIDGRIVNGTRGDRAVAGTVVKLFSVNGQQEEPTRTTRTDGRGFFRFNGLATGSDYTYLAATLYKGAQYNSPRMQLTDDDPIQDVTIRVYETTLSDAAIRVSSASMMVLATDKTSQSVLVLETFDFVNPGDRTFTPSTRGPSGQMGLLRFSLPPNAYDLEALGELSSRQVIQVDKGFATDLPIRPGDNQVAFTYSVPYYNDDGRLSFSLQMPYPTREFRLLVPLDGPRVASPQMRPGQPVQIGSTRYATFRTPSDRAGVPQVSLSFSGLPVNVWFLRAGNPWLWAGAGGLLALLVALALWLSLVRGPRRARPAPSDREQLVRTIALLDDRYEAGEIDEESYRRQRGVYKEALVALQVGGAERL